MSLHKKFKYETLEQVIVETNELGLNLNFSENLEILSRKVDIGEFVLPNSLVLHPMEGADGDPNGMPGELTKRRYERFSKSGAGLIWFEATAVVPEARANPRQLWIHNGNVDDFKRLRDEMVINAPVIMQLTHSGRYSKPTPIPAAHNPYLDKTDMPPLITDGELDRLTDVYVQAAILAKAAGFDGVDVKACHGYLNSELLSAFTREGRYGGTLENRTRFLTTIIQKIRDRLGGDFIVTTRMNIHDGLSYPYGWGETNDEPKRLIATLRDLGVKIVNLTMGNPYHNPHVNRPYDNGPYVPEEHPLVGVARLINGIGEIQTAFPEMAVIGTGYSWLRQFSANLAAGTIESGKATLIGYGRECFAYPDFPTDILNGGMKKEKCCIACGRCTELMRAGLGAGCVVRDTEIYGTLYGKLQK